MATGKRDNVRTTSPDGGATRNISNSDLETRLRNYQNRGKGAKFTAPTEGKPTGNRARGAQQAKAYGDKMRASYGGTSRKPATRRGVSEAPTTRPPVRSVPTQPMGAPPRSQGNYRPTPLTRTQQPLVYAPQGPLPPTGYGGDGMAGNQSYRRTGELQTSAPVGGGYQAPQQRPSMFTPGAPPQPQYNPLPQQPMQPQSGYMPPQGNPNVPPMTAMEMYNNPWGRKW